jgi:hypothetical protein
MDCSKNPPPSPFFKGGSQKSFSLAAFIDSPFRERGNLTHCRLGCDVLDEAAMTVVYIQPISGTRAGRYWE